MKRVTSIAAGTSLALAATGLVFWNQKQPATPVAPQLEPEVHHAPAPSAGRRSAVPAMVKNLVDPARHLDERIEAIRSLPTDLSQAETAAVVEIFYQGTPDSTSAGKWYVLVNELMEVLRQPRHEWSGFGSTMEDLMKDRHLDPVVRDYAAQHLAHWLGDSRISAVTDEVWAQAMATYLTVLGGEREAFEPVVGTSLMALSELYEKRGPESFAPIRNQFAPLLSDYITGKRPASMANRISAIQAAGRISMSEALPQVRELARNPESNPSLRLSSVAALGYFKDPADKPFLEELASSDDRLRFAAREALKKHQP
jgi:hypothetical protein